MKPETAALLARARADLDAARRIVAIEIPGVAAREAYMAAFHAAQAVLFERDGEVPKTHSGLHGAFGRVARDEPGLGRDLGRIFAEAYEFKDIADYRIERIISTEAALKAIERCTTLAWSTSCPREPSPKWWIQ